MVQPEGVVLEFCWQNYDPSAFHWEARETVSCTSPLPASCKLFSKNFSEHSILLPQGDSYVIFLENFPLALMSNTHSSCAGKRTQPKTAQIASWSCMFEALFPSSPLVSSLMSCVIKWLYTVTLCWWWTWPVGRGAQLPNCIDFSSADKLWIALLTEGVGLAL